MRLRLLALVPLAACLQTSGTVSENDALRSNEAPVVYGSDDRMDVYAHPDGVLRARAKGSTVALMHPNNLDQADPQNVKLVGSQTLKQAYNLCDGERFPDDPTAAFCSGTLIDDDL